MKNLLLCLLFLLATLQLHSQTIPLDSFYVPGATWTALGYATYNNCSHCWTHSYQSFKLRILADSAVSGRTYHILGLRRSTSHLTEVGYDYNYHVYIDSGQATYHQIGSIYVESSKVYFVLDSRPVGTASGCTGGSGTYSLFDSGLIVTDSVHFGMPLFDGKVTRVDSMQLSDGRYITSVSASGRSTRSNIWYYGIGNASSPIDDCLYEYAWHSYNYYTICYENPFFEVHLPSPYGEGSAGLRALYRNCFDYSALGIADQPPVMDFTIYPNPIEDNTIHIDMPEPGLVDAITVTNAMSKEMARVETNKIAARTTITTNLVPGVYLIKILMKDHSVVTRRLVKY